jgi:flagellar basal body rod protein FlgF
LTVPTSFQRPGRSAAGQGKENTMRSIIISSEIPVGRQVLDAIFTMGDLPAIGEECEIQLGDANWTFVCNGKVSAVNKGKNTYDVGIEIE